MNNRYNFWIAWTIAVIMIITFRINKTKNHELNKHTITHNEHSSQPI